MKKISNVTIRHMIDESPDYSTIGEYTDELRPGVIVRSRGDFYEKLPAPMERDTDGRFYRKGEPEDLPPRGREMRGFIPYAGGETPGTAAFYRYGLQDFKIMEAAERGDWSYIGIKAEATITTSEDGRTWLMNRVSSGGLWGVGSDSGEEYFAEVAAEELVELRRLLLEFGFTSRQITAAFKNVETKEE